MGKPVGFSHQEAGLRERETHATSRVSRDYRAPRRMNRM